LVRWHRHQRADLLQPRVALPTSHPALFVFADITVEACANGGDSVENGLEEVGGAFLPGNVACVSGQVLRELPPPAG